MSFGWGTKWTLWKNAISFTLHPLEFCLLQYHVGLQNQRSRQNDGGHPKQNPAYNYANRFSSSWSRQNKVDRGKPIQPPTCYYSRKAGELISSCPEKWRVAPKGDGFLAKTLSLTAVGNDTPPSPSSKREDSIKQVLSVKSLSPANLSWIFFFPSSTMVQCHCQLIRPTPYQSRFWQALELHSLYCWVTLWCFLRSRPLVRVF